MFRRDVIVGEGSLSLAESAKQLRNTELAAKSYRKAGDAPAAPPKKQKVQKQEKTAEKNLKNWLRKLKLAESKVKKYK